MTACVQCQALRGAPSSEQPHEQLMRLREVDLGSASHGQTTGIWTSYFCKTCGSLLLRDQDEKDPGGAQWSIPREG